MVDWPRQKLLRPVFVLREMRMATEYEALVMRETDGAICFEYTKIPGSNMPDAINGESVHHICYV